MIILVSGKDVMDSWVFMLMRIDVELEQSFLNKHILNALFRHCLKHSYYSFFY